MSGDIGGSAIDGPTSGGSTAPRRTGDGGGDRWLPSVTDALNRPQPAWLCVLGWFAATGIFLALVAAFAGPGHFDPGESDYSTWAIAHGDIACAYPSVSLPAEPPVAPLYPLLSGGIAAVARLGDSAPFPSAAALGPDCDKAFSAMNRWVEQTGVVGPTLWIGCVTWLALMAGVIAWLRAAGRGRRGWEPVTLMFVAGLLPVWMCVQTYFHPQDLLALGLALCAMAYACRRRWVAAGVLCALAVLSQQFALLVAAPLFVLAPATRKVSFAVGGLLTGAIVVIPLAVMTSGHVLRATALGTGDNASSGGTVLWETHAYGAAAVLLFRVAPLAVSVLLSWWVLRRLGPGALRPVAVMSLVAVSLALRLVFEANFNSYYFMALAVTLVLLEATAGSVRRTVAAWLAAMTLWICRFSPLPFGVVGWGAYLQNDLIPFLVGVGALLGVLTLLLRGGDRRNLWPWLAVAAVDFVTLLPGGNELSTGRLFWAWQVILVVPGILLAAQPLLARIRQPGRTRTQGVEPAPSPAG